MYNWEDGHSRDEVVVKLKIREYKKAIKNLGGYNMQRICISTNNVGIGNGMSDGTYVDLSEEPFVYAGIKKALEKMLEIQEEILEEIELKSNKL